MLYVFGLLAVTVALFVSDRIRPDVVALLAVLGLLLGGIMEPAQALSGFGDPVVILIALLFVVGEGLVQTGIAYQVGAWLVRTAGASETRLLILLMLAVAGLGAFMSSTGVVAIFIPIVVSICTRLNIAPGRLMMPLSCAALLSGMLTLIATPPNLVINNALLANNLEPFGFFDITSIGVPALAVGILYMWLIGRRLLPRDEQDEGQGGPRQTLRQLVQSYQLENRFHCLMIGPETPFAGMRMAEADLSARYGVTIIGVSHREAFGSKVIPALGHAELRQGDSLYVMAEQPQLAAFAQAERLIRREVNKSQEERASQELGLVEIILPPQSRLIGLTLPQTALRTDYGLNILGIRRQNKPLSGPLSEIRLAFGDQLLAAGSWNQIRRLSSAPRNFLVLNLPRELADAAPAYRQAPFALAILAAMVVMMVTGVVSNVAAVLIASLAMGLCRCLRTEDAYRSINWSSLVVIAGMLPLARALEQTGGVALIADALVTAVGGFGPLALLAGIFLLASLVGMFISNTATAVLVAPIAISAAVKIGVSPYPFAMTVAIAASAAFVTPVSSPVNTLVMDPGGYRFNDYVRVGVPLLLLIMVLTLVVTPLFFPFHPGR
jgi:di/tricarboxylate transporter